MLITKFDFPERLDFIEIESSSKIWRTWKSQVFPCLRVQSKNDNPFNTIGDLFVQRTKSKNFGENYKLNINYRLRSPQPKCVPTHQITIVQNIGKYLDLELPPKSIHGATFSGKKGNWLAVVIHEIL